MTPDIPQGRVDALGGMGGALHDPERRSIEWFTPPHIFAKLLLTFDLDPCAPAGGVPWIPARRHFSIEDDGLAQEWHGRVWLNPPYGREAGVWARKLASHGDGIALVFARTDSAWFQEVARQADAICLVAGRLSFIPGMAGQMEKGHNAAAASALLAYGAECADALRRSGLGLTYGMPAMSLEIAA
jgi:hypothetical protein